MSEPAPCIDAYCHVGLPRFGSAEDAWTMLARSGVERAVFVLGPGVPDYATLFRALRDYGQRVRGIGIPFGETSAQVRETVALQLRAGVLGLRVTPHALLTYPKIRSMLGARGGWIYAIGAVVSPEVTEALLAWLQQYPECRVAAPHFLAPRLLPAGDGHGTLIRELVGHPRFYPIFSRHGGTGSRQPYPHADLRDWVEQVVDLAGWDHILWGSEYPVLYWRDESVASCQAWLPELLGASAGPHAVAFLGGNAERVLFGATAPNSEPATIPDWVDTQFNRDRTVPLFPGGLDVSMSLYARLHHRYVETVRLNPDSDLSFGQFAISLLEEV
jgi:predicted TIM-barrel fold metal-dependent hydrolase